MSIEPDEVERAVYDGRARVGYGPRTEEKLLKYLKAATRYVSRKTSILDRDPLAAVDLPSVPEPDTDRLVYTASEVPLLTKPTTGFDWRVTLSSNIAADTGRRIGAIRCLALGDVAVEPGRVWLRFRNETDKSKRTSSVPVSEQTADLILQALERLEVQSGGWLLPGGREGSVRSAGIPWGGTDATGAAGPIRKLHEAEETLKIDRVPWRGYHGIKRAHVTVSWGIAGGDAAKADDLTGNTSPDVLRRHYSKARTAGKIEHMERIRATFSEGAIPEGIPEKRRARKVL
jgi:integrase